MLLLGQGLLLHDAGLNVGNTLITDFYNLLQPSPVLLLGPACPAIFVYIAYWLFLVLEGRLHGCGGDVIGRCGAFVWVRVRGV